MAEQQLLPFRMGSRQRKRQVGAAQSVAGLAGSTQFVMPKVGLINYLLLLVRGTVNLSAGGAFATLGPWSLVNRIRVDLNLSNMNLVDYDGWHAYQMARLLFRGYAPDGGGNWTPNATVFSAGVASGNNSWVIPYLIPVSANPGSDFDTGLINVQAPEVQMTVDVRLAAAGAEFITNFSTLTGVTAELHEVYFTPLDPRAVLLPLGQIVRTVQQTQPIVATGENSITIERQGKLMNSLATVIANGTRNDSIERVQIVANINDTMYDETGSFNKFEYEHDYSMPSPTGVFTKDFWHAKESPSMGDGRDLINLEVLTTFQQKIFLSSGVVLGSGNNFYHLARRILVNFASPATAGVQSVPIG